MASLLEWLYRRLRVGYFLLHLLFDAAASIVICLATVGLFSIYQPMSAGDFWIVVGFAEAFVMAAFAWVAFRAARSIWPVVRWVASGRGSEGAREAWEAGVRFPREAIVRAGWPPFVVASVPLSAFLTVKFDLPYYSAAVIFAASLVAIMYAAILTFFGSELFYRPVLRDIARQLPNDFASAPAGVSLRWKLLGTLPLINVITGVVVSGLSTTGTVTLSDLGVDVVVAVVVAFTISLELTVLLTKSVVGPIRELLRATERVGGGDLSPRVPVTSGDELGALATSFNAMVTGLEERERLRAAFGSYVDPGVAERVLAEGELLEGQEREATVMFVDVRDFTAFAEKASASEAVAQLNDFFGLVVPIVMEHGGHANKFIGDGLLAVFGVPERQPDHASRAVAAACAIAAEVERRYAGGIGIGIGINSGPVIAGSIGGGGRLEFTVIGDPVNVAARVEKATRELGDTILLTEATRCLLTAPEPSLEARGSVDLRGKSEPIPVYSPAGVDESAIQAHRRSSSGADRTKVDA